MNVSFFFRNAVCFYALGLCAVAAPMIDPIANVSVPAGKSLIIPITATSPTGRPLTFTAVSSTNRIAVEVHTNNPFWKMTVVQVAPADAPGAFQTSFRGGIVTVTNLGDMTFMLFRDIAPHTVDVLQGFTMSGLYTTNTIFHRVVPGFVIQGGDPSTNGSGGPVFHYDDEFNPSAIFSGNGQLAMANSGKDTDGSQFFITTGAQRSLDFGYTLFGQLLRGFNVLTNVINTPVNTNSRPFADVIITRASFVPDNFDTVLTLTGTNLSGIMGTIKVIADDGAGGWATNSFTATTVINTSTNYQPFLDPNVVTNLVASVNVTLTNIINAIGLDGGQLYWFVFPEDTNSQNSASISGNYSNSIFKTLTYNVTNINGQLQFFVKSATNYIGPVAFYFVASSSSQWSLYKQFGITPLPPYDQQKYAFVFGDTPIVAQATNFTAQALIPFTNQLLAMFTNGVPNSDATNFTAFINWGDNTTNSGVVTTNLLNQKEVYGSHTYLNAGDYPVDLTIKSAIGAAAIVVSTASVPPMVTLTRTGISNAVRWPAWALEYVVETNTSPASTNWGVLATFPALNGYDNEATNSTANDIFYIRLKK